MHRVLTPSSDVRFNLALMEYFLKEKPGAYFMVFQHRPCVVIGRNQNASDAVRLDLAEEWDIDVLRRLKGGGAVYQDEGCVNVWFLADKDKRDDRFQRFVRPVADYLCTLGLDAAFGGRNDLLVSGKKVGGNAQTLHKDRVAHGGTVMFDVDLERMFSLLQVDPEKYRRKGLKSAQARVMNVKESLPSSMSLKCFREGLIRHLEKVLPFQGVYQPNEYDKARIKTIKRKRYDSAVWNRGVDVSGTHRGRERFDFGEVSVTFTLKQGKLHNVHVQGDFFADESVTKLEKHLENVPLDERALAGALHEVEVGKFVRGLDGAMLVKLILQARRLQD